VGPDEMSAYQLNGDGAGADRVGVVVPFLLGTAVGGVAGAVVGTLLSRHTTHAIVALINMVDRRLSARDRDELRFELLLQ